MFVCDLSIRMQPPSTGPYHWLSTIFIDCPDRRTGMRESSRHVKIVPIFDRIKLFQH